MNCFIEKWEKYVNQIKVKAKCVIQIKEKMQFIIKNRNIVRLIRHTKKQNVANSMK